MRLAHHHPDYSIASKHWAKLVCHDSVLLVAGADLLGPSKRRDDLQVSSDCLGSNHPDAWWRRPLATTLAIVQPGRMRTPLHHTYYRPPGQALV